VQRDTRFGSGWIQTYGRAEHRDPGPHETDKMLPLVLDQQVLIGCKRSDALGEIPRSQRPGLASAYLHEAEHVLGAIIRRDVPRHSCRGFRAQPALAGFLGN
jgi:hypothetical protein